MLNYVLSLLFKERTAYEVRISDWSSDVCSSDLCAPKCFSRPRMPMHERKPCSGWGRSSRIFSHKSCAQGPTRPDSVRIFASVQSAKRRCDDGMCSGKVVRSEEHTSELQSLMRSSYAVFCLQKKTTTNILHT